MTLEDMTTASEIVSDVVDPDANIIVGTVVDESLEGQIQVTVIATGFESSQPYRGQRNRLNLLSQSGGFNDTEIKEPGPGIPEFLRLRQVRRDTNN